MADPETGEPQGEEAAVDERGRDRARHEPAREPGRAVPGRDGADLDHDPGADADEVGRLPDAGLPGRPDPGRNDPGEGRGEECEREPGDEARGVEVDEQGAGRHEPGRDDECESGPNGHVRREVGGRRVALGDPLGRGPAQARVGSEEEEAEVGREEVEGPQGLGPGRVRDVDGRGEPEKGRADRREEPDQGLPADRRDRHEPGEAGAHGCSMRGEECISVCPAIP